MNEFLIEAFPNLSDDIITKNSITLKVKNLRETDELKKEAMICSKIYELNGEDYKILKWWFQLNKDIGFEKIVIYNNTIQDSKNFDNIFTMNQNFVKVLQIQCFPNFFNSNKFLRKISDLKFQNERDWGLRWLFEVLIFNECYLENIDKYKYISIIDQDELIIPRMLDNFHPLEKNLILINEKNNNSNNILVKHECNAAIVNTNNFFQYKNELKKVFNFDNSKNIHFKMGYYLKDKIMRKIFKQFKEFYQKSKEFNTEYCLYVVDLDPASPFHYPHNYTFKISNQQEHEYAIYLYKTYYSIMIPFYEKTNLEHLPETYNRVFYLATPSINQYQGKTIHSPKTALHLAHHTSYFLESYVNIPYSYGHVSHFRDAYKFANEPISIGDLYFDLNYFNCYFAKNIKN